MINTLREVGKRFDDVYHDILSICLNCTYHDCEGYIWLLPEEEAPLAEVGAEIIEISGSCGTCCFINPLDSHTPRDFEQMKPKCPLRINALCSVHDVRPLVCRIYPIGFLNINGEVNIILSKDCEYSHLLSGEKKRQFVRDVLEIFGDLSETLYNMIVDSYAVVDGYFKYPEGPNEYEVLGKL